MHLTSLVLVFCLVGSASAWGKKDLKCFIRATKNVPQVSKPCNNPDKEFVCVTRQDFGEKQCMSLDDLKTYAPDLKADGCSSNKKICACGADDCNDKETIDTTIKTTTPTTTTPTTTTPTTTTPTTTTPEPTTEAVTDTTSSGSQSVLSVLAVGFAAFLPMFFN